jgi:hypothetical protein
MATEISNGRQTVKLYRSVNRGKAMYQLAYYAGGRRVQRNFSDKSEAKRVARAGPTPNPPRCRRHGGVS